MTAPTWETELLHRHADGTEHAHAGSQGFTIGGQVIADTLGDEPHQHTSITLRDVERAVEPTGGIVWSERLGEVAA